LELIEAKNEMIEAKTKDIEAKTKEIEAKCLSEAEIKVLITDDCSKNSCQNAKPSRQNRDSDEVVAKTARQRFIDNF
jgi:hypothetical protein